MATFMAGAMMFGLAPMSMSLGIVAGALLVWRVENTRCPVSAACKAVRAVSRLRISPTSMTSGSCLRIDWRPVSNVYFPLVSTCVWVMPLIWYSTGFSIVTMLIWGEFIFFMNAYSVVVFPDPVGPVVKIMQKI